MKRIVLVLLLLISVQALFAQKKNTIKLYYGSSDAFFAQKRLSGGGGYDINHFNEFGLRYNYPLSTKFSLESGINYSWADITITSAPMPAQTTRYEKFKLLSFPFYGKYNFGKYFWLNGGPILDFQQSTNSNDKQSGIGYSLGLGSQIYFKNFFIYVNPNYKRHDLLAFHPEKYQQRLTEIDFQFGLGFNF